MEKWNDFLFGTFGKKSVRFRNFSKQSRKKYRLTSSMDSWTWDTRVSCPGRWESLAYADPARKGPCRIRIGWQSSRNKLPSDPWTPSRKRRGSSRKKRKRKIEVNLWRYKCRKYQRGKLKCWLHFSVTRRFMVATKNYCQIFTSAATRKKCFFIFFLSSKFTGTGKNWGDAMR